MSKNPEPWSAVISNGGAKSVEEQKRKFLETVFIKAVRLGDVQTFEKCLRRNVNPNTTTDHENTALHIVAEYGSTAIAKRLLKMRDIIVDPVSQHGSTPLLLASLVGNIYVMILLIEHGANVHFEDPFGRTPLHWSVNQKHIEASLVLLKSSADPNQFDSNGLTPLHLAAVSLSSYSLTLILLKYGASPVICTPGQLNVFLELCLCTYNEFLEKILLLVLKRVPNINIVDSVSLRNGLHMAALTNYVPTIKILLDRGANRHLRDAKGFRPIDVAKVFNHQEVANFLETYIPDRDRSKNYNSRGRSLKIN